MIWVRWGNVWVHSSGFGCKTYAQPLDNSTRLPYSTPIIPDHKRSGNGLNTTVYIYFNEELTFYFKGAVRCLENVRYNFALLINYRRHRFNCVHGIDTQIKDNNITLVYVCFRPEETHCCVCYCLLWVSLRRSERRRVGLVKPRTQTYA